RRAAHSWWRRARTRAGYARIDRRIAGLAIHAGGCAQFYAEKISGARSDQPELAKVLKRLAPGDVLLVTRLDRLARSTRDLLNILDEIAKRGAGFKSAARCLGRHDHAARQIDAHGPWWLGRV